MAELEVQWPEADLREIGRVIHRAQDELGKDIRAAVEWAAVKVAGSAAARTEVAPKTRDLKENPGGNPRFPRRLFPYYREVWIGGPSNVLHWFVRKDTPTDREIITRAGLAKKSWYWMIPAIRYRNFSNFAVEVEKRTERFGFEIELSNKLSYIRHALKVGGDGQPLLNEALGAAAKRMDKDITRRLEKAAK